MINVHTLTINLAATGNKRVFIPASGLVSTDENDHAILKQYTVRSTLNLTNDVRLCGASRSTTVLSASARGDTPRNEDSYCWRPVVNSPIVHAASKTNSKIVLNDLTIHAPSPTPSSETAFAYVYQLHWQAGRDSVVKDVW